MRGKCLRLFSSFGGKAGKSAEEKKRNAGFFFAFFPPRLFPTRGGASLPTSASVWRRETAERKGATRRDQGRKSSFHHRRRVVAAGLGRKKTRRARKRNSHSPLELDEGLALADVALDGHHGPVALALVADVGAPGVLAEAADEEDVARLHGFLLFFLFFFSLSSQR